ncbi:YchJ family protein [Oceanisphaera avium]|uniref:SecC motif-containing protein n=1 Tax=Oceanisphaera avium TaxID=1903694 RepID=A0A1Y0CW92_9GAMM|nr:YchJ family metal-binding protein [Oceanisphaera avium]ART79572.1 SecC motif-containing protein [Oceanisphaera avium]
MRCHCHSQLLFSDCCQPYLSGLLPAPTPIALMRSRYTAFVLADGDYLLATWHPATKEQLCAHELAAAGRSCEWLGLKIIFSRTDTATEQGVVEFKARYKEQGKVAVLHEQSYFERVQGNWRYKDGVLNPPKIPANQPCPCGKLQDGRIKKYKHCCAQH